MERKLSGREKKLLKKSRVKELIEVYSGLLTDREKKILTLYTDPNMSGALIARKLNVSRQAIHDHIRRAMGKMERCEARSNLVILRKKKIQLLAQIEGILNSFSESIKDEDKKKVKEALKLIEDLSKIV
jgi:hypothetical protein